MAAGRQAVLRRREFCHYQNGYSGFEGYSDHKDSGSPRNWCRNSSNAWNFVSVQDCHGRKEEREPGELSSESGLENEYASDFQVNDGDDVEVQFPPKRRKISPIVPDREEKEVRISSLNVDHDQGGMTEDFVQTLDVTMSRWASDGDTPRSELDDEDMHEKKSSSSESGEFRALCRASSADSGGEITFQRPSSEGDRSPNESFLSDYPADDDDNCSEVEIADSDEKGRSPQVHRNINMLQSCRSVFEFEKLNKINEGTYGVVYKAKDKKTGNTVALKKVKMDVDNRDGFPLSSLREINILLSLNHPSIVDVKEVVMDGIDTVFLVMEYMEHDLKGLMEMMKQPFSIGEVKFLMLQLLKGVKYLHDNWVLHRDLKTSNILLNKEGDLKICDFGLSRQYGSPLKPYTPLVVTLRYRAPELLLNTKQYSTAIDMWSIGCIMAELVSKEPLFTGKTEIDQLNKIYRILGTPDEKSCPGLSKLLGLKGNYVKQHHNSLRKKFPATSFTGAPALSEMGLDLLNKLLTYDPDMRISAEAALNHGWFHEAPFPKYGCQPFLQVWEV